MDSITLYRHYDPISMIEVTITQRVRIPFHTREDDTEVFEFPTKRDIYTMGELTAMTLGKPIQEVELDEMKRTRLLLIQRGAITMLNGGKLVRWGAAGGETEHKYNPTRLYAVRNADKYTTLQEIREHLRGVPYPNPTSWTVGLRTKRGVTIV